MDLGLLIIANLIMRTRLPPKARSDKASPLKEVILDVPYLIFVLGSFLVSYMGLSRKHLMRMWFYSVILGSLRAVYVSMKLIEFFARLTESLVTSLLPATSRCCSWGFSNIRKILGT
jgi:hypothetical protein